MKVPATKNSTIYQRLKREGLEWLAADGFIELDEDIFKHFRAQIEKSYSHLTEAEKVAESLICCFTHSSRKVKDIGKAQLVLPFSKRALAVWGIAIVLLLLLLTVFSARAHGQSTVIRGAVKGSTTANSATVTSVDSNHNAVDVNIAAGGGTGGGPADAAPNTAASESDVARQKVTAVIRLLDTSQSAGSQLVTAKGDQTSGQWVNCKAGCSAAGDTTTGSTALGALNAVIAIALAGERGAAFQLQSGGTLIGTVTPQCSFDGGTIYNANGYLQDPVTGVISLTATIASAQGTTDYQVICPSGTSNAQMKVTAYTSGTANWLARATVITWPSIAFGIVTTNAPSYTTGLINGFSLDTAGLLRISLKDTPANTNAFKVDGSGVTQPVSGTVTANAGTGQFNTSCTAANCLINEAQISGTAVSVNSGTKDAGTQRFVIATDQPQLTNALKVDGSAVTQPVSGTVTTTPPANASTNVAQLAGTTTDTNSGTKSAGTLRVVIATDQPQLTNKLLVTPDSVALPANQSVNLNQVGGTAVVADPCQANVKVYDSFSVTASTQLITGTSAKKVYFCSWNDQSAAAENYAIVEGTGSVCATGIAKLPGLSGGTTAATGWNVTAGGGRTFGNGTGAIAQEGTNADNVCILLSGSTQVNGGYSYVVQ